MRFDNTKKPGTLKLISLGDVHLGHHATPTELIIRNLDKYCTNETTLTDVDLLIITGDLFDRLLSNADNNVNLINRWITRLLFKCSYLNVKVRIVEGTPAHDRGQSVFFIEQKANATIPVDVHYASTLSVEYIDTWDCWILYVPDKWRAHTSDTLVEVKTLLKNHQLDQVDLAIMHGAFDYQYPVVVIEPTHDPEQYLKMVKHYILIGHIHLQSQYERILAAGSYDRICHGEEGPKGFYSVVITNNQQDQITFIENKGAKRYITLECHGMDIQSVNVAIRRLVETLPKGSAIRLRGHPQDAVTGDMDAIKQSYPEFHWTLTVDESKKKTVSVVDVLNDVDFSDLVDIQSDNILSLIEYDLKRQLPSSAASIEPFIRRLSEIIDT